MPTNNLPSSIESLRDLAESRFAHANFRKTLRERIDGQLAVAHNGGLFKATPELISFLHCWTDDIVFIEDSYHNPIRCDRNKLLIQIKESYQFAMNAWHIEFDASKNVRKITSV